MQTTIAVERSVWIDTPRQRVWQAITDADYLSHWYQHRWEIPELEVGAPVKVGNSDSAMVAAIAVVDPPRVLALYWLPQPQSPSMFTRYKLEKENGGTRVTVTETSFEALSDDLRQLHVDQTAEMNAIVLDNMKAFLEGANTEMKTPGCKAHAAAPVG
jgi:uncharacterized protein YndB with AHSA1/START domain